MRFGCDRTWWAAARCATPLLVALAMAGGGEPAWAEAPCGAAPPMLDDWAVAAPANVGLDPERLCAIGAGLVAVNRPNLHAVLVVRHGKLAYEAYAAGRDQFWGTDIGVVAHDAGRLHDMRSVSKSVVSLLVGIAIDRGRIAGVEAPVLAFFPGASGLDTPELRALELRHLLTMTPGFAWSEGGSWMRPDNDERRMYAAPDASLYVLSRPSLAPPGERWHYNSGATAVLGAVIETATGQRLDHFAQEALFGPLGIGKAVWIRLANGSPVAGSGLRLRPRDMARIGQLVLGGGVWNGRRIVSERWIRESTQPRFPVNGAMGYGYQWSGGDARVADRPLRWIAAIGHGGQRIVVVPALDLVVAITAGLYDDPDQDKVIRAVLEDGVLPAVRDAGAP